MTKAQELFELVKTDTNECLNFNGTADKDGYQKVCWNYKTYRAHRLALSQSLGRTLESYELACHTCDNPSCVNPRHLFVGSEQDNHDDMVKKGRSLKGERHHNAKLTDKQTSELRQTYKAGGVSQRALAAEYGLSQSQVQRLVT